MPSSVVLRHLASPPLPHTRPTPRRNRGGHQEKEQSSTVAGLPSRPPSPSQPPIFYVLAGNHSCVWRFCTAAAIEPSLPHRAVRLQGGKGK